MAERIARIPAAISQVDTDKTPAHVGEGVLQGMNKLIGHVGTGAQALIQKPRDGLQKEGTLGAAKGVCVGMYGLGKGMGQGACDFVSCSLEGVRSTPDAVLDVVYKDRPHYKHGVNGDGEGGFLETFKEGDEPQNVAEGVLCGFKSFGRGLAGGVSDLATKPITGARNGGVTGFAQGLGQGAIGCGSKAAAGYIDLVTSVVSGVKNTPVAAEKKAKQISDASPQGWVHAVKVGVRGPSVPSGSRDTTSEPGEKDDSVAGLATSDETDGFAAAKPEARAASIDAPADTKPEVVAATNDAPVDTLPAGVASPSDVPSEKAPADARVPEVVAHTAAETPSSNRLASDS
eukprot:TRINITY_DN1501_c0_g1_i4.p1 TRINITY_DN1501_c0_g1~~TRINITY_DN1501_c0_g1_i4.p1  ORF type:complete len:374 (-),score=68.20 TRINITY_DN1501_c0_g1_i4:89-1123(-)